jgi:hypothetical protein
VVPRMVAFAMLLVGSADPNLLVVALVRGNGSGRWSPSDMVRMWQALGGVADVGTFSFSSTTDVHVFLLWHWVPMSMLGRQCFPSSSNGGILGSIAEQGDIGILVLLPCWRSCLCLSRSHVKLLSELVLATSKAWAFGALCRSTLMFSRVDFFRLDWIRPSTHRLLLGTWVGSTLLRAAWSLGRDISHAVA